MKSEVYSWRVSTDLKTGLEREARRRQMSVSALLDMAAREWLVKSDAVDDNIEEQRRLHQAVDECFGVIASGNPRRSQSVRQAVRKHLRRHAG